MLDLILWSSVVAGVPIILALLARLVALVSGPLDPPRVRPFLLHGHAFHTPHRGRIRHEFTRLGGWDDDR